MEYNEKTAIEAIKNMHIRSMNKALNLRKKYNKLDVDTIIENEYYINNNKNQYNKHLI
jgi:hypothetical protein